MTDSPESDRAAVKRLRHEQEHLRLHHEREAAGVAAAEKVIGLKHPTTAAEVLAAAQDALAEAATTHTDDPDALVAAQLEVGRSVHAHLRHLAMGGDIGVLVAQQHSAAAQAEVAAAQRAAGKLTPGSRMANERNAAADEAFEAAKANGATDAAALEAAHIAGEKIADAQEAAGGPLDTGKEAA